MLSFKPHSDSVTLRANMTPLPPEAITLQSCVAETFKKKLFGHTRFYTTPFDCLLDLSLSGHRGQKSPGRICCNVSR